MFRRLWTSGPTSLRGPTVRSENIRPTTSTSRYIEVPTSDLSVEMNDKGEVAKYIYPEVIVHNYRPCLSGRMYLLTFPPELGRQAMYVEGVERDNILRDVASISPKVFKTLPYAVRIYELDTSTAN